MKGPSLATYGIVGVSSQVAEVITMLHNHKSKDVVSLGIWGVAGIGKTTIARHIFYHICYDFERTYFISNDDGEPWERKCPKSGGLKKVLVVVDGVNRLEQLGTLSGDREWFGEGSRIMITGRDVHLLQASPADLLYNMKVLSDHACLELFSREAFKQAIPEEKSIDLSRTMVDCTAGVPLSIKVLGCCMFGQSLMEWKSTSWKLAISNSDQRMYNILRLSYDSLNFREQEIFITLVVIYIGEDMNDVIQKLDGSGCNARTGIKVLMDRSLVTVDNNSKLRTHDLLQDMARKIIREISQDKLQNRGIDVFKDDVELPRENYIKTELIQAIGSSKIAILIFSKEYARSKWCLEELSLIMEFHKSNKQVVLPVFYDVEPSEIRNQTSSFGEAFKDLIRRTSPSEDEVSRWRTALSEAGGIYGFDVGDHMEFNNESEYIQNIVKIVHYILNKKGPLATYGIVGVSSQVQEVITMLRNHESKDVVSIGIWGVAGGLKKVLVVVDGVNRLEQLDTLKGDREWFGEGSRIIITSRDLHLLQAFPVNLLYNMKVLSAHASLELFSREAFKQAIPEEKSIDLSRRMVDYTEGLPLSIKVLGCCMFGQSLMKWNSASSKLDSSNSDQRMYNILRLSYDSLNFREQEIFITLVVIYIGEDMNDVIQKLDGSGCNARTGIKVLMDRSLVTVDKNNKLRTHDLLQDMARKIIREISQNKLQNQGHTYEVFLSYRGEDTWPTFTSHLYSDLCNAGIDVFELPRENYIKTELIQAIGSSKIAILIFSKEYARSKWFLEELSLIMEFHKSNKQVVLPVFYDVEPSEIRNQTSSFGEAFKDLIRRISPSEDEVSRWRTALSEAGGIYGFDVGDHMEFNNESEYIQNIVKIVHYILNKKGPLATYGIVGVSSQVQEVITMLRNHKSKDVVSLGIWGVAGIGKTTIARHIFYHICYDFERTYFISNDDGEAWERKCPKSGGLKKVLVVVDGVNRLEQLDTLRGDREWFGEGSRIIITSRDLHLLQAFPVNLLYNMKVLSAHASLELFSREAFKQASPKENFIDLSRRMVDYTEGLPLSIKVLGCCMFGQSLMKWNSASSKLDSSNSDQRIYNILRLSYDSLDFLKQEIFISLVVIYIGEDMNVVIQKLDGSGCNARTGIKVLMDRSLVTVDKNNKLRTHDLLQDMARKIIREISQNKLQNREVKTDDVELPRENYIKTELIQAIGSSKIAILIFSKEYARSKWFLEELSLIMEFHKSNQQVVLPVFYDVDPSEIRNQTSSFREAFQYLIQRISPSEDEVSRWRTTLSEAGGIYGFDVGDHMVFNNESEYIQNIVKIVHYILSKKGPLATYGIVGVSSQVQEVITMLRNHESKDVVSIGIWGMAGIGKTTIARLIFDHIHYDFESTYFLSNDDGEAWERKCPKSGGLKKVLVVVDGVNRLEQLDTLRGDREWFGEGSRIIITSRDLHLLKAFPVNLLYNMKVLSAPASLELFSREAFKQASPKENFIDLSRRMVDYTEGLPLSIKVLGCCMFGQSLMKWNSASSKLDSSNSDQRIYNILRLSYDSLHFRKKELFINIVAIYIGEDMNDVIQKLDGSGCNARTGIKVLMDRNLVSVDKNNKLRTHDLLQDMARKIIRENSQNKLRNRGHMYEVFLSFRGEDTRATFTSHLYSALCNAGIVVFKDDVELPRGDYIKKNLMQAIGSSKIAILVFSKEYARSKWCLEELSLIMEFHKSNQQVVLPVFYDVDPSEIRNQTSSFGEAFKDLIRRISLPEDLISNWRKNLAEAGSIAGIVVLGSRDESKNVEDIVEHVCNILDKKDLFVVDHPVGVDDRVQELIEMIQYRRHQHKGVVMVGIWGMGGIGKTTIAKAIYNAIGRTFESRSYLPNIREVWDQKEGQVCLMNQLLSEICKTTKMKINSTESGINTLKDRLRHKKALVVLDDVDELDQLNALVGSRSWFKAGSTIIITTRDERLLRKMGCQVYIMKNLDEGESLKLFSWHAFKQESPKEDFTTLSTDIVKYSGRLPLALEVLGSYLFDRKVEEWKRILKKLKKIPNKEIQKKLQISFDGLDDLEKEIFLDISCFFIGMDKNDVTQILNGCDFYADVGIKTLVERSLVIIDEKNKLGMHDLLRDMGREIIRVQSQNELGKRSRLWFHKDTLAVLLNHMGTETIEGLSFKLSPDKRKDFQTEAFKMMKRLRLLHLDNVQLEGDYECISRDLRWLCWHGFSRKRIPNNFYQKKLVAIDLKYSSLKQVWKEPKLLKRLKILNLSHSHCLVQTPNFSNLPNLEKLILKDCRLLSTIHHSIGLLDKLLLLDLEDCIGISDLPRSIYRLKCLQTLILSGCINIEKLEEDIEQMESLTTLMAPTVKQVPFSLVRLKSISYLSVSGYEGLSHYVIPSLYQSWMSLANNPLPLIPKQRSLLLEDGWKIPSSLETTPNCVDISRLENCLKNLLIQIGKNSQVFHMLSERVLQGLRLTKYSDDACILPGDNYPYWQRFMGEGASVKFKVPPVNGHDHLKGMTICCIYIPVGDSDNGSFKPCIICLTIVNYTRGTTLLYTEDKLKSLEEAEKREIISNLESDDQVEVKAIFGNGFIVKKTAVYLIYTDSFDEKMETSISAATSLTGTKHKLEKEEEEEHQSLRPKKSTPSTISSSLAYPKCQVKT
ncbi:hypothetical protein K1719_036357 [Acacia pycnantha]|nr:hypothetical protein K1719_036357 [Acacia pycnantha]